MSKANHDRNIIKLGSTKKDDREWDRLEDRLQTDPNLGGGGPAELIVPGTYVPQIGLPPGIPYIYVIGNLMEGYPIDTTLTGALSTTLLRADIGNYFGLGSNALIGAALSDSSPIAYKVPNSPVVISGPSGVDSSYFTTIIGGLGSVSSSPIGSFGTFRVRTGGVWVSPLPSSAAQYSGAGPSADGSVFIHQGLTNDVVTGGKLREIAPDGTVIREQTSVVGNTRSEAGNAVIIQNGWMLAHSYPTGSGAKRTIYRPAEWDLSGTALWYNLPLYAGNAAVKRMSIGTNNIAWLGSAPSGTPGVVADIYRYDLLYGTAQVYTDVVVNNLGEQLADYTIGYVSDNCCAYGGYYFSGGLRVPVIGFVAFSPTFGLSVTIQEFPELAAASVNVASVAMVDGTTTMVAHITDSSTINILYGLDTSTVTGIA